jgi:hypothetical protein
MRELTGTVKNISIKPDPEGYNLEYVRVSGIVDVEGAEIPFKLEVIYQFF